MSAEVLYDSAEKKTKKLFFKDFEGAQDLFTKAAVKFKVDKNYIRAGEAFSKAGDCATKIGDNFAAGQNYADAASMYRKSDLKKAASMLEIAVQIQIDNNRLGNAARLLKEYAEALEEQGNGLAALPYYEKAMQYFNAEDQKAQAQNCMIAMGKIYAENEQFDKALMYFERIAFNMLNGPLKFQAQEYFLRAMLCRYAMVHNDNRFEKSEETQEALDHYLESDMYMKNTREAEFLQLVHDAVAEGDLEKFEEAVSLLHSLRKLDELKTKLLMVTKNNMESIT